MRYSASDVDALVGSNIRQFRRDAGLTQTQVGEMLGVTFQQVQKYESGTTRVSASGLHRLANGLGVGVAEFFVEN